MARTVEELQRSADAYSDDENAPKKFSRRTIIGAGAAAAAMGVAGGIARFSAGNRSENIPPQEKPPMNRIVIIDGIEVDIDQVVMPDLYTNTDPDKPELYRPWADPEQFDGMSIEERVESARMPITPETRTDEGVALMVGQIIDRIANSPKTPNRYLEAQELGYPWEEYAKDQFISPMMDALFSVKYSDPRFAGVDETLKDFLMLYVDDYETALKNEDRRDGATLIVNTSLIESQRGIISTERSLAIGIETKKPAIPGYMGEVVYKGHMTVNIDESADGDYYDLGIQQLVLDRQ